MKSRLGLTEDQEAQIRPILEDESVKRHAIIERYQGQGRQGRSSLRNELQQLRASTEHRFESILTKAQMEEYRKMQEEARQRMRQGGPGSTRPH
jgi:Spy/CpxP family protein refolding chaperone